MNSETLSENRKAYQDLAELLDEAGLAKHALFLNWGYLDNSSQSQTSPGQMQRRLVTELIGITPVNGRSVIDVGCGRGGAAAMLLEHWRPLRVTGVDLSPANITFCRQNHRHPRLRFQIADACRLPQPDNSADLILNLESSGAYVDLPGFFAHVMRILKPGGDFLYADIFASETVAKIDKALSQLGFQKISARSLRQPVLSARSSVGDGVITRLEQALISRGSNANPTELRNYFALPGTPIYRALEKGEADYHCFHWRKPLTPSLTPHSLPASMVTALGQRSQQLERVIQTNPSDVAATLTNDACFPLYKPQTDAAINVFALPYAGGGASIFREWGKGIGWPTDWTFSALQLPARENRIDETGLTNMADLVAILAKSIAPYTHRPWALLACSLGCKIAFELARHFEAKNAAPKLLFFMACPAPGIPINHHTSSATDAVFIEEVRKLGGTPPEVLMNAEMMQAVGKALRADCALAESYLADPSASTSVPIVLMAAEDDHLVPLNDAIRWQDHCTNKLDFRAVNGGHFFMRQQRSIIQQQLVQSLRQRLPINSPAHKKPASINSNNWLPFAKELSHEEIPVFCFHHAGGNAAFFREWLAPAQRLGLRLCPVELPGRASRFHQQPYTNCFELVTEIAAAIKPLCNRPFALFGHSLGALIAFEIAHLLPQRNLSGLFISGRRPPHMPTPQPHRHTLSDQDLTQELLGLAGTPEEVLQHPELIELFLPALRADFTVTETYPWQLAGRYDAKLSCILHTFCGDTDAEISGDIMDQWLRYGSGKTASYTFSGGHFYLQQHRDALLRRISIALDGH